MEEARRGQFAILDISNSFFGQKNIKYDPKNYFLNKKI